MTPMNGQPEHFKVTNSGQVIEEIKRARKRALELGISAGFRAALQRIYDRLRENPRDFGEPLFDYRNSPFQFWLAVAVPLAVQFVVHHDQRLVVIRKIIPMFE